nr:hypothetical protein [Desulfobacteraceae bacterium]
DKIEKCLEKHSLNPLRLYCPENHFEKILELISGIFSQYRGLYRVDPFSVDTVLGQKNDSSLFLHIGEFSEIMLKKAQNSNTPIHFFCGIQTPYEPNGRHIKIKYNCDLWPSPDAWLGQIN